MTKKDNHSEQKQKLAGGEQSESRFSKEQLLSSKQYTSQQRDVLTAVLSNNEGYSHEEAQQMLQQFLNKGVR